MEHGQPAGEPEEAVAEEVADEIQRAAEADKEEAAQEPEQPQEWYRRSGSALPPCYRAGAFFLLRRAVMSLKMRWNWGCSFLIDYGMI